MKNIQTLILLLILFLNTAAYAQKPYYKINGGKAVNEKKYVQLKNKLAKEGKIEELNLKTVRKSDSIIHYIKLGNLMTTPDGFDPYGETKKFIGTKFKIENFAKSTTENFKDDYLNGKPTLINFWFTRCPPCIQEIPTLNKLKDKFGDKVNFVSITFDNQKAVDEFLKKYKFEFEHIINSQNQIDGFSITAYPTSFILDKNGIIKIVTSEITEYEVKDIESTLKILL